MSRSIIIVLDSLGIGSSPDSRKFGDYGANTLLNIAKNCYFGLGNNNLRKGPLFIPNLCKLGLDRSLYLSCGQRLSEICYPCFGGWAAAEEISVGKDTPSGHWEIVGVPIIKPFNIFDNIDQNNIFPEFLLKKIIKSASLNGSLGNCYSSGTDIIKIFGEKHIITKKPIFYTSKDSVFQVACHEKIFGLNRLYNLCKIIRKELDNLNISRVIARPFDGYDKFTFKRTDNRKDYMINIPKNTLFDNVINKSGKTILIGKIIDIFPLKSISLPIKLENTKDLFYETLSQISKAPDNSIIMTNFVNFDQKFGHRRNIAGYAYELEYFDKLLPKLLSLISNNDILAITADHGCDPSWYGFDHTREYVPQLIFGPKIIPQSYGIRKSFADLGQTIAHWMNVLPLNYGEMYKNYINK